MQIGNRSNKNKLVSLKTCISTDSFNKTESYILPLEILCQCDIIYFEPSGSHGNHMSDYILSSKVMTKTW